jgi:hypothetical protein
MAKGPKNAEPTSITLRPPGVVPAPPYGTSTFTFANNPYDVSIVFMRVPLLGREQSEKLRGLTGPVQIDGEVVGAITLPRSVAVDLANSIKGLIEKP